MWLGDLALLQPQGGLPSGGRAQFAGCQVHHFGADYGPGGIGLLLPVYRSTTPIPAGMQLLVPGYVPSTPLPAGEWITLPARRSWPVVEEGVESLG